MANIADQAPGPRRSGDEPSLAAIGPNPLGAVAFAAGRTQGSASAPEVAAFWGG